jgi:CHASE2 domain-containing sensor protein
MRYVNYAGGGAQFPHLTANTVIKASTAVPWQNFNPLKGRIALIGGSFRAARDRYVTPVGYLDGVDILALTILSIRNGIVTSTATRFFITDLLLGFALLTATWFFRRTWVLLLSFVLIPVIALLISLAVFTTSGYFFSFIPIISGVFFHHLVEHAIEHRKLTKEVSQLRQEKMMAQTHQ